MTEPIDKLPKKIVKINLLSYSINPIFKDNYEKVEKDFKEEFYNRVNKVRFGLMMVVFSFFFGFTLIKL